MALSEYLNKRKFPALDLLIGIPAVVAIGIAGALSILAIAILAFLVVAGQWSEATETFSCLLKGLGTILLPPYGFLASSMWSQKRRPPDGS